VIDFFVKIQKMNTTITKTWKNDQIKYLRFWRITI